MCLTLVIRQQYTAAICPQCFLSFVRISFLEICTNRVYYKSRDEWTVARVQNWPLHHGPKGDHQLTKLCRACGFAWCETQVRIPARTVAIITIAFQVKGRPTDFATGHDVKQCYQFWHFKHTALYKVYLLSNLSCLHLTLWHVRGEEKCIEGLAGKPEDKWPLGRPRHWWTNDIQRDRKEVECEAMSWVYLHNKIFF
jgi:hypothetical protein